MSVALQALMVISMGSVAARSHHITARKPLLLTFALLGGSAAIFLSSSSPLWILSALPAVCANVGFCRHHERIPPTLARESPEVVEAQRELDNTSGSVDVPAPSIDLDADHVLFTDLDSISAPLLGGTPPDHQSHAQE
ncbi:hypothetical protein HD554DRAFT_2166928 [Boletus coccyginus]|nr:hypothetical protein HD554DRAFT_2166928 [Boletus coccyginus]